MRKGNKIVVFSEERWAYVQEKYHRRTGAINMLDYDAINTIIS